MGTVRLVRCVGSDYIICMAPNRERTVRKKKGHDKLAKLAPTSILPSTARRFQALPLPPFITFLAPSQHPIPFHFAYNLLGIYLNLVCPMSFCQSIQSIETLTY